MKQNKQQLVRAILQQPVYSSDSQMYQMLEIELLKLSKATLSSLGVIIECKRVGDDCAAKQTESIKYEK